MKLTASVLFAGAGHRPGLNNCYYCGADCDETHRTADLVKETFTNRDIVFFPGSAYVCSGCAESLGAGPDSMLMIDGSTKARENRRGMQPRMYSWILTRERRIAATKAHMRLLRAAVLDPPEPPFAIVLADSGQKQLIFRAPIAMDREVYPLLLEDERIEVVPAELRELLALAGKISAALGKPALLGEIGYGSLFRYETYFGDTDGIERWLEIRDRPMSRLAAWLAPSKEDAQNEYRCIERTGVPADPGRTCGSEPAAAGGGTADRPGHGDQTLFDLG